MLAEPQSRTIDGVTYHVLPLGSLAAMRVAARVLKMAAPAFGDVASLVAASKAVGSSLEGLAVGVVSDIDEETLVYAMQAFARVTSFEEGARRLPMVSDNADHLDEHFRGRFVAMLKWLAFAASVSFPFVEKALSAAKHPAPAEA